jgi:hypothetical protein
MEPAPGNADAERDSMDVDRETKLTEITDQIRQGEYRVDPKAVADAIIRRLGVVAALSGTPAVVAPGSAGSVVPELRSCAHTP